MLVLALAGCTADKTELVRATGPQPGLLYEDGDFWYGLRNWTHEGPVEIWPDVPHYNTDSFCVIRRGGWIRYSGPTFRVLHADTILLAGNACYLTNYAWWPGARMRFSLRLYDAGGVVVFQTAGYATGDLWNPQCVHNFTAPAGVVRYDLTYWTDNDSAMVDGCVLRQYPNQSPPPPPPPPPPIPDTLWSFMSVRLARNRSVTYPAATYGAAVVRLRFSVAGSVTGKLVWSNGTTTQFTASAGTFDVAYNVPPGVVSVSTTFKAGRAGAVLTGGTLTIE